MPLQLHFLGWDEPLVTLAMERLMAGWTEGVPDLDRTLIVTPTRQSGRRLGESLVKYAAERDSGIFPPRIATPDFFLRNRDPKIKVASDFEMISAWIDVLSGCRPEKLSALKISKRKDARWAMGLAGKFCELRNLLAESGYVIGDMPKLGLEAGLQEIERWKALAELESAYLKKLGRLGIKDANLAEIESDTFSAEMEEYDRIILIGVCDPMPLAIKKIASLCGSSTKKLERADQTVSVPGEDKSKNVEVWVYAPEEMSGKFDGWGCPIPEKWEKAEINFGGSDIERSSLEEGKCRDNKKAGVCSKRHMETPLAGLTTNKENEFDVDSLVVKLARAVQDEEGKHKDNCEDRIRLAGNPEAQADEIIRILHEQKKTFSSNDAAVSVLNENIFPYVEKAFSDVGVKTYNPGGDSVATTPVFNLIMTFANLAEKENYESFSAFIRNPDFLKYLASENSDFVPLNLLKELDEYHNEHLPERLDDFFRSEKNELKIAVNAVVTLIRRFKETPFTEFMRGFLSEIYRTREIKNSDEDRQMFLSSAELVSDMISKLEESTTDSFGLCASDKLRLFMSLLKKGKIYPQHDADALALQGWLELPWESAETLVIAGMNEGYVPDSVVGDVFLPDLPREKLGLKSNRRRFARDIYLMTSIIESRKNGKLFCIAGKTDVSGDPLKPSRLFFLCPSETLVERVDKLFGTPTDKKQKPLARTLLWKLNPKKEKAPEALSVTDFKNYLNCPFRFYLKKVLKMEEVDDRKTEMDQMDFGNFCHRALDNFCKDENLRKSRNAEEIKEFLHLESERLVKAQFGSSLPLSLLIQLESVKQRLAKFAEIQALQSSAGWEILHTEYKLGDGKGVNLDGMTVKGKIDRIDRHADGTVRILDYKTSDKAESPENTHVKYAREDAGLAEYAVFEKGGKLKSWVDLQLPLYQLLLEKEGNFRGGKTVCGYFNLPKAVTDTGIEIWEGMGDSYLKDAEKCASGVIESIRKGIFWPPSENIRYDDFEKLFFGSPLDAVEEMN
ncbi:MAG: PD-(D/E)XK nuclease family protein [Victivallales bacterium]|jgi:ATP-dependent helicase/nuclease subunit B